MNDTLSEISSQLSAIGCQPEFNRTLFHPRIKAPSTQSLRRSTRETLRADYLAAAVTTAIALLTLKKWNPTWIATTCVKHPPDDHTR